MIIRSACFTDGGGRCLFDMGPCVYISMSATKRSVSREREREQERQGERAKKGGRRRERETDVEGKSVKRKER